MAGKLRWVAVVCAAVTAIAANAQSSRLAIAGAVYQDRLVLAVRPHFLAAENVTVKVYRDDGDRTTSAADVLMATTKTGKSGMYVLPVAGPGLYWLAVDSRTFHGAGWPEQTFGPGGSLCASAQSGTHATIYEGSCFGGRSASRSDDASTLMTSEHVALVNVRDSVTNVDFAFSFDAVINTLDGEGIQGSLRQYFVNANEVRGLNRMRFVPVETPLATEDKTYGFPQRWWTITLKTPLPELTDADTLVDGTAHNPVSPSTIFDLNAGRFAEPVTLRSGNPELSRLQRPELEIVATGERGIVCAAPCGLRAFALHGAVSGIVARADVRAEHVLVGVAGDAEARSGGRIGVDVERGTFTGRHVLVSAQSETGIRVAPGARVDGEHLEVSRSGAAASSGAGIALLSSGSSIRSSNISSNAGAGVLLGSADGKTPATLNTVEGTIISGNTGGVVVGPGSTRNTIVRNDIMWNRGGGVTVVPFAGNPPLANRISANRFDENGLRPIVLNLNTENPNDLERGSGNCSTGATAVHGGISAPRMDSVTVTNGTGLRAAVRGRACPGQVVEIYQSFATASVRGRSAEMPEVRNEESETETISALERALRLPSIGEFNYLGTTTTGADGTFSATFPLPGNADPEDRAPKSIEDTNVWAAQVLTSAAIEDRAFSAIAIDATGNTSEMSVRRKAD
jgi:hypothetical protein